MELSYLDHPAEESLERFVLEQSDDTELTVIETHVLACDSCVARLESLEIQVAAIKLAFEEIHKEKVAKAVAKQQTAGRRWFGVPQLALMGVSAALLLGLSIVPRMIVDHQPAVQVSLMAYRGIETPVAPRNRALEIHLNANDLNEKLVEVSLVDAQGKEVWKTNAPVQQNEVSVQVPKISQAGTHFFRLYTPQAGGQGELLREFGVQIQ